MTGETYDKLETILQQVSYVKLSAIPLLSRIKKIQIADERIYLWDLVVGIVCYDMSGELLFQFDGAGNGYEHSLSENGRETIERTADTDEFCLFARL